MKREYRYDAADGKEMRLDELRDALNDTGDLSADSCTVKVRITMAGTVKSVIITETR